MTCNTRYMSILLLNQQVSYTIAPIAQTVRSEGLEPSTFGAEIRRSIQLNYERATKILYIAACF